MKYKQKSVVVDAVQWNGQNTLDIQKFVGDRKLGVIGNVLRVYAATNDKRVEYALFISQWLIAEKNGDFRVCSADTFDEAFSPLPAKRQKETDKEQTNQ
jgi:hypothetical protein